MTRLVLIVNPVSGDKSSKAYVEEHVLPAISAAGSTVDKTFETKVDMSQTAAEISDYLLSTKGQVSKVVIVSGDGTLSELPPSPEVADFKLDLALIPAGTANALYSSIFPPPLENKLLSLQSLLSSGPSKPLTLGIASLAAPPEAKTGSSIAGLSCVVASTSLHASILYDSESLRDQHPSIERFKIAAQQNSTRWANASVKLLPDRTGHVQVYDPTSNSFVASSESSDYPEDDIIVDLDGPFAYFLSTVNVDRLEPGFRITPLQRDIPPSKGTCELVVVRPSRDPSFEWDTPEAREAFVPKLWEVLQSAYKEGEHVTLRYAPDGSIVDSGEGRPVVEYFRCSGWEWYPIDSDERAHLLCVDGAISKIPLHGRASFATVTPDKTSESGFRVYI
ncbi:hypothetical protein DL96DRAFT_1527404 [Flagelloscypha sp. PMI_526]|nr:hypothetical protein DL96DRAFT_1527404 [Flagelloscypha sp. PMI_526]